MWIRDRPTTNKLIINLPESTVTLNGTSYTAVEATTAGNTLIVPEGVTVGKLNVVKGNVEIYGCLLYTSALRQAVQRKDQPLDLVVHLTGVLILEPTGNKAGISLSLIHIYRLSQ